MLINTSRFGQVAVRESEILTFSDGILGFADLHKFVLLDDPKDDIFAWLQSCEESQIAFPVLEPELFSENYKVRLTKSDLEALKMSESETFRKFCIVTIPDDPAQMTANLKAPLVVNIQNKMARQCVLQDNQLAIREPIFAKLQQRVMANPDKSIKSQAIGLDVAVRVGEAPSL